MKRFMSDATPTVVIVGRPNVGKSTLFNRITGQRRAIVGDEPGITRDRIHGSAEHDGRRFELIDTGGIVVDDQNTSRRRSCTRREVALERAVAHHLAGGRPQPKSPASDRDLARMLLRLGKPVTLAVNKADTRRNRTTGPRFYALGIRDMFPVSAEHGIGVDALLDHVTADFAEAAGGTEPTRAPAASRSRSSAGRTSANRRC